MDPFDWIEPIDIVVYVAVAVYLWDKVIQRLWHTMRWSVHESDDRTVLKGIAHEFRPNEGDSLRDVIDDIQSEGSSLRDVIDDIQCKIDANADRMVQLSLQQESIELVVRRKPGVNGEHD